MPDTLTKLQYQAEDEGLTPGTKAFEFRVLTLKVERCKELQAVTTCSACKAYLGCEMTKEHARWKQFGEPKDGQ